MLIWFIVSWLTIKLFLYMAKVLSEASCQFYIPGSDCDTCVLQDLEVFSSQGKKEQGDLER